VGGGRPEARAPPPAEGKNIVFLFVKRAISSAYNRYELQARASGGKEYCFFVC